VAGLLAKAVGGIAKTVERIQAAGEATRTRVRDRRRSAGQRARAIAAKLRLRGAAAREEGLAAVLRITGQLADIAEAAMADADAVLRNARRGLRTATGRRRGRLHRAINDLATLLARTEQVIAQTRSRMAAVMPDSASRIVSFHDVDARPIRKGRLGKPVDSATKPRSSTTPTELFSTTACTSGTLRTRPSWRRRSPASPTGSGVRRLR
jgi:IS5 family transposase